MSAHGFDGDEWLAAFRVLQSSLDEDGAFDDWTSRLAVPESKRAVACVRARESCVLAGVESIEICLRALDAAVEVSCEVQDGALLPAGSAIATLRGPLREILAAERSLLNLLALLCGTATQTRRFVEAVPAACTILDTRKTIPGLRRLQKYAVRCGGGANHRFGLDDAFLLKDNHRWPGLALAAVVQAARQERPEALLVVEVDSLEQLEAAFALPVDRVLLDNFTTAQLATALQRRTACGSRVAFEASGGIDLARARELGELGIEFLSVGALTHSVRSVDLGLDLLDDD